MEKKIYTRVNVTSKKVRDKKKKKLEQKENKGDIKETLTM